MFTLAAYRPASVYRDGVLLMNETFPGLARNVDDYIEEVELGEYSGFSSSGAPPQVPIHNYPSACKVHLLNNKDELVKCLSKYFIEDIHRESMYQSKWHFVIIHLGQFVKGWFNSDFMMPYVNEEKLPVGKSFITADEYILQAMVLAGLSNR